LEFASLSWNDPLVGILEKWERSWGYIGLRKKKWLSLFPSAGVRFVLHLGSQELFDRHVDKHGRIYVGKASLREYKEGEELVCYKDTRGEHHIDRAKSAGNS